MAGLYPVVIKAVKVSMLKKLSELSAGQAGTIDSFSSSNDIFIKLMEMGCIPGERVMVDMIAPLGDPISIHVAGYQLSLRLNEAEHIFISTDLPANN